MSEALFRSVRSALAFAYSVASFTTIGKQSDGPLAELSLMERQAQGALIRRIVEEQFSPLEMAVTFAYHGAGRYREAGVREVCWQVAKLLRNRSLGVELAKRHFAGDAERRSYADIAQQFGTTASNCSSLDELVGADVARLRLHTDARLTYAMVNAGISGAL